ncbi:hypothetical protein [Nitrososphaera viennensis]|uniref:Uncharacterized protein n=2 Tax=Nitrososphaera viennensis TaxID=1034015 RepID=A0A060HL89_9ARCH|nr:hypothetical protein [Nitrososphaera viennensis]AIC16268.1 hypothetical protein NVIE_020110 [Nitrososphaera viennensis EN76]UVS68207.1 hypothetical protein NWT39_09880 [Nitrososphaera viennensis]
MGLLTWVIVAVVVVLIIGIGVEAFFSGLISGAEKLGSNPVIKNATEEGKNFAKDAVQNATSGIVK